MQKTAPSPTSIKMLIECYDALLIDAYGVLVNGRGPLEGASAFIERLRTKSQAFSIVTNDASRLPETCAQRYQSLGIHIEAHEVLTSGSMITEVFQEEGLQSAKTMVLGTEDTRTYVKAGGGELLELKPDAEPDAVVVADEGGYNFLQSVEAVLSALCKVIDAGKSPRLYVANPDIIYPKREGEFGYTGGAVALLLEAGLNRRYPGRDNRFTGLGKPYSPIFNAAKSRHPDGKLVMVGDQLDTDILGANNAGIDSVLMLSGVAPSSYENGPQPTYVLQDLSA